MRVLRWWWAGWIGAALAGCDASPAASEPGAKGGGADGEQQNRPADGGLDVPPSGTYEVTTRVVNDDCSPKYTPPAPWRAEVQGKAERGRATVNVPVSALPPRGDSTTSMRSDFVVLPPAEPHTRRPELRCGPTEQTWTLSGASREGFTLALTTVFGARPDDCDAGLPASCTTKIEQTFKLVTFACAAECYRGARSGGGGELVIDCRCP